MASDIADKGYTDQRNGLGLVAAPNTLEYLKTNYSYKNLPASFWRQRIAKFFLNMLPRELIDFKVECFEPSTQVFDVVRYTAFLPIFCDILF